MLQEGPEYRSARTPPVAWLGVLIAVILFASVAAWLVKGAKGYFVVSPGSAPIVSADPSCRSDGGGNFSLPTGQPCVRLIVPAGKAHAVFGSVMMVDVLEGTANWNDYLLAKLGLLHTVNPDLEMIPAGNVLGNTPASQLACQSNQDMSDSTSSAAVVALRTLHYQVTENDLGARVYEVVPGTAATAAGVHCDDLVTKINGSTVHTDADLANDIHLLRPGQVIHLSVVRAGRGGKPETLQLSARLTGTPALAPQPAHPNQAFLGVQTITDATFSFPYHVTIEVGDIGGPSAGLALTLGLLDALSNGQLTGGHRIAATGTIDVNGNVGPIGDAAQKAIAVRRAGAQIFFVPPANYKDALSEAGSMKVYEVSTLAQALADLKALGGQVPAPVSGKNGSG